MSNYKEFAPWYCHPVYNRYWEHYSLMTHWLQHHVSSQNAARSAMFFPQNPPQLPLPQYQEMDINIQHNEVDEEFLSCSSLSSDECSSGEDSNEFEFELELTDEMLAMMDISKKYRRERDKLRKAENEENNKLEYVELGSIKTLASQSGSGISKKLDPLTKMEEMKVLYGDKAAVIYGMETAMTLSFDRAYDLKQPRLWPVIPIRL